MDSRGTSQQRWRHDPYGDSGSRSTPSTPGRSGGGGGGSSSASAASLNTVPAYTPGDTELHALVSYGYVSDERLERAIRGGFIHLDAPNDQGRTALFHAVQCAYFFGIEALAYNGANVNAADIRGQRPMHVASQLPSYSPEVIEVLYNFGGEPEVSDSEGMTPLHVAASARNAESIVRLLGYGARVNTRSHDGDTPLHMAISSGDVQAVKTLLRAGASLDVPGCDGLTPLQLAAETSRSMASLVMSAAEQRRARAGGAPPMSPPGAYHQPPPPPGAGRRGGGPPPPSSAPPPPYSSGDDMGGYGHRSSVRYGSGGEWESDSSPASPYVGPYSGGGGGGRSGGAAAHPGYAPSPHSGAGYPRHRLMSAASDGFSSYGEEQASPGMGGYYSSGGGGGGGGARVGSAVTVTSPTPSMTRSQSYRSQPGSGRSSVVQGGGGGGAGPGSPPPVPPSPLARMSGPGPGVPPPLQQQRSYPGFPADGSGSTAGGGGPHFSSPSASPPGSPHYGSAYGSGGGGGLGGLPSGRASAVSLTRATGLPAFPGGPHSGSSSSNGLPPPPPPLGPVSSFPGSRGSLGGHGHGSDSEAGSVLTAAYSLGPGGSPLNGGFASPIPPTASRAGAGSVPPPPRQAPPTVPPIGGGLAVPPPGYYSSSHTQGSWETSGRPPSVAASEGGASWNGGGYSGGPASDASTPHAHSGFPPPPPSQQQPLHDRGASGRQPQPPPVPGFGGEGARPSHAASFFSGSDGSGDGRPRIVPPGELPGVTRSVSTGSYSGGGRWDTPGPALGEPGQPPHAPQPSSSESEAALTASSAASFGEDSAGYSGREHGSGATERRSVFPVAGDGEGAADSESGTAGAGQAGVLGSPTQPPRRGAAAQAAEGPDPVATTPRQSGGAPSSGPNSAGSASGIGFRGTRARAVVGVGGSAGRDASIGGGGGLGSPSAGAPEETFPTPSRPDASETGASAVKTLFASGSGGKAASEARVTDGGTEPQSDAPAVSEDAAGTAAFVVPGLAPDATAEAAREEAVAGNGSGNGLRSRARTVSSDGGTLTSPQPQLRSPTAQRHFSLVHGGSGGHPHSGSSAGSGADEGSAGRRTAPGSPSEPLLGPGGIARALDFTVSGASAGLVSVGSTEFSGLLSASSASAASPSKFIVGHGGGTDGGGGGRGGSALSFSLGHLSIDSPSGAHHGPLSFEGGGGGGAGTGGLTTVSSTLSGAFQPFSGSGSSSGKPTPVGQYQPSFVVPHSLGSGSASATASSSPSGVASDAVARRSSAFSPVLHSNGKRVSAGATPTSGSLPPGGVVHFEVAGVSGGAVQPAPRRALPGGALSDDADGATGGGSSNGELEAPVEEAAPQQPQQKLEEAEKEEAAPPQAATAASDAPETPSSSGRRILAIDTAAEHHHDEEGHEHDDDNAAAEVAMVAAAAEAEEAEAAAAAVAAYETEQEEEAAAYAAAAGGYDDEGVYEGQGDGSGYYYGEGGGAATSGGGGAGEGYYYDEGQGQGGTGGGAGGEGGYYDEAPSPVSSQPSVARSMAVWSQFFANAAMTAVSGGSAPPPAAPPQPQAAAAPDAGAVRSALLEALFSPQPALDVAALLASLPDATSLAHVLGPAETACPYPYPLEAHPALYRGVPLPAGPDGAPAPAVAFLPPGTPVYTSPLHIAALMGHLGPLQALADVAEAAGDDAAASTFPGSAAPSLDVLDGAGATPARVAALVGMSAFGQATHAGCVGYLLGAAAARNAVADLASPVATLADTAATEADAAYYAELGAVLQDA